jgi:hypothetical protein
VNNAAAIIGKYQERVENLETDRWDGEEIDRDELRDMVLQEGAPALRRWFRSAHQVPADTGLTDVDAEFEHFATNTRCSPGGIFLAHLTDQIAYFARHDGTTGLATPNLPSPGEEKAFAIPCHDGFRSYHDQRRAPIALNAGQVHPEDAI